MEDIHRNQNDLKVVVITLKQIQLEPSVCLYVCLSVCLNIWVAVCWDYILWTTGARNFILRC